MSFLRLLLTLFVALLPATALGQLDVEPPRQQPKRISRKGTEMFRWLLDRAELKPMTDAELMNAFNRNPPDFRETVVIVIGPWDFINNESGREFPGNRQVSHWMTTAAQNGGAVLVAYDANPLENAHVQFGGAFPPVQFSGRRVYTPQPLDGEEWRVLNGDQQAVFGVPLQPPPGRGGPEWDLLGGDRPLTRVVTEYPGTVAGLRNTKVSPLAAFPPNSVFNDRRPVAGNDDCMIAGVASSHPWTGRRFRFLAVADHAVFMNAQMVGPTDNLEFADRAIRFLSEEPGQNTRKKCLLVVNGKVQRNYDELNQLLRPPLPPLPKVDWAKLQPKLVDLGNHLIDQAQEKDIPNQLFTGKNPDAPRSWYRIFVGLLLTIAAIWAAKTLVRRVWGAREPTDLAGAPPGGRPPPPPDGAAGVFGRRGKELTTRDNLLEPARAACRDFFDTVGRPPEPGPRLPKVVITDVVRKPDTLRQALRDIWAVAYGRPHPVTAMRWAALEPLLARALAAHRDHKWRFVEAEAWPDVSTRPRGEE